MLTLYDTIMTHYFLIFSPIMTRPTIPLTSSIFFHYFRVSARRHPVDGSLHRKTQILDLCTRDYCQLSRRATCASGSSKEH